jgi:hypothetical protein
MNVALSIAFTGLCALVTDGGRGPGQVLLVDGRGVREVGGVALPQHAPTLVVSLRDLANPGTSSPTRVVLGPSAVAAPGSAADAGASEQIGIWDLSGSEVRVRVPGRGASPLELFRPADGLSSWPNPPGNADDAQSWRDIRFVASMNRLAGDGLLRPSLLARTDDTPSAFPRGIAGRVVLDGGRVEAGLPSEGTYRGEIFEFRGASGEPRLRQALTDTVRWRVESDDGPIVLEIIPISGGPAKRLVFVPGAVRNAYVSNLPTGNGLGGSHHAHAASDDQVVALHFGAYYELLEHVPADRALPRVTGAVLPRRGTGMVRPLICTPALFDQR